MPPAMLTASVPHRLRTAENPERVVPLGPQIVAYLCGACEVTTEVRLHPQAPDRASVPKLCATSLVLMPASMTLSTIALFFDITYHADDDVRHHPGPAAVNAAPVVRTMPRDIGEPCPEISHRLAYRDDERIGDEPPSRGARRGRALPVLAQPEAEEAASHRDAEVLRAAVRLIPPRLRAVPVAVPAPDRDGP